MSYRVAYEEGNGCQPHAEDHRSESAARVRETTLREAGISRVVIYEIAGTHEAPCWCLRHGPGIKPKENAA